MTLMSWGGTGHPYCISRTHTAFHIFGILNILRFKFEFCMQTLEDLMDVDNDMSGLGPVTGADQGHMRLAAATALLT